MKGLPKPGLLWRKASLQRGERQDDSETCRYKVVQFRHRYSLLPTSRRVKNYMGKGVREILTLLANEIESAHGRAFPKGPQGIAPTMDDRAWQGDPSEHSRG